MDPRGSAFNRRSARLWN